MKLFARCVLAASVLFGALIASPASAALPTAYNTKTQFLTSAPSAGLPASCVSRTIFLAQGNYNWGSYYDGPSSAPQHLFWRGIFLATGNYDWTNCLTPRNGDYLHSSRLHPHQAGLEDAVASRSVTLGVSGTWTWGGYLDPQF